LMFFPAGFSVVPKMGQEKYFRANRGPNCMDVRVAKAQASCCGVNLAVAGFGVGLGGAVLFPRAFELCNF
jgi:hypothetical protein